MRITDKIKKQILSCESSRFELCASLHDEDIPELVEILKQKPNIQYLDLTSNKIELNGVISLTTLEQLIHLNLSSNNIDDEAVKVLLQTKNLRSIHCSRNPLITNKIGEMIINNPPHHLSLLFDRTGVSGENLIKIERICTSNRILKRVSNPKLKEEQKETDSVFDSLSSNNQSSDLTLDRSESMTSKPVEKISLSTAGRFLAFFKRFMVSHVVSTETSRPKIRI